MTTEDQCKVASYQPEPHTRKEARRFVEEFKSNCGLAFDPEFEGELARELEEFLDSYTPPQPIGDPVAWRKDE